MGIKTMGLFLVAVFAVFALPTFGHAAGAPWKVVVDTPQAFEVQAASVRKEMGPHGQYSGISASDRAIVEANLDKIDALLRKRGSAAKLDDRDQVALMNAQERVNAVLTHNEGNRLICTLEPRTGTKFKHNLCGTHAALHTLQRTSQQRFPADLRLVRPLHATPPNQ